MFAKEESYGFYRLHEQGAPAGQFIGQMDAAPFLFLILPDCTCCNLHHLVYQSFRRAGHGGVQ